MKAWAKNNWWSNQLTGTASFSKLFDFTISYHLHKVRKRVLFAKRIRKFHNVALKSINDKKEKWKRISFLSHELWRKDHVTSFSFSTPSCLVLMLRIFWNRKCFDLSFNISSNVSCWPCANKFALITMKNYKH